MLLSTCELRSAVDQNSLILLKKACFNVASIEDLTSHAMQTITSKGMIADGDLMVLAVSGEGPLSGKQFILAAFHGDTDGLATESALKAINDMCLKQVMIMRV